MTEKERQRQDRKYLRFNPDGMEFAIVSFTEMEKFPPPDAQTDHFQGDFVALILNESYSGCNLVFPSHAVSPDRIKNETLIYVKVGPFLPMRARIVWSRSVDDDLTRAGIEYLD